jgi:hypothetical protein
MAAACGPRLGERVILKSSALDPDVFFWDTRRRMIEYAAGVWSDTKVLAGHAVLLKPGTLAITTACLNAAVHPAYASETQDAIGVRLIDGPYHGRYGWVPGGDVHPLRAALVKEERGGVPPPRR